MAKVLSKMKEMLGLDYDDFEDDVEEYEEDTVDESDDFEPVISQKKANKVVNIHTNTAVKVMLTKPAAYEDATEICNALRNRKIVVVNTTALDNRVAQRLIDFISGSCYALSGELQEIERGVYILSPSTVEVSNELKTELSSKGIFGWK